MCSSKTPSTSPVPVVTAPPPPPPPEPTAETPVVENPEEGASTKKRKGKQALRIPLTTNVPGTSGTSALNIPTG